MPKRRNAQITLLIAALLAALTNVPAALAQTSRPAADETPTEGDAPLLAGPPVEPSPTDEIAGPGRRAARDRLAVPPRRWLAFVTELDLEPEQRTQVRAISRELQAKQRAFQREHGAELRSLREQAQEMTGDAVAEIRRRIETLRENAPRTPEYQQRIWDLLDEAQQDALRARLAEARREIARRQRERTATTDEREMDADERRLEFLRSRQR